MAFQNVTKLHMISAHSSSCSVNVHETGMQPNKKPCGKKNTNWKNGFVFFFFLWDQSALQNVNA